MTITRPQSSITNASLGLQVGYHEKTTPYSDYVNSDFNPIDAFDTLPIPDYYENDFNQATTSANSTNQAKV